MKPYFCQKRKKDQSLIYYYILTKCSVCLTFSTVSIYYDISVVTMANVMIVDTDTLCIIKWVVVIIYNSVFI